jgi:hypothetical protein
VRKTSGGTVREVAESDTVAGSLTARMRFVRALSAADHRYRVAEAFPEFRLRVRIASVDLR